MWKERLMLAAGETLKFEGKHDKGNMGQEEIERYSIIDSSGKVTGSVQYTDHVNIKAPFKRSLHVVQRNNAGGIVVDQRWTD